jgi:hypothetical protein
LPNSGKWGFGVYSQGVLDETLSRHFFGATDRKLDAFLSLFYSVVYHLITSDDKRARITSSRQDNQCELTGAFIPKNFPYIVFDDQGHVSLSGFYGQLAFLSQHRGAFFKALVAQGADPALIIRLCDTGLDMPFVLRISAD